jgi:hypothetical protein
MEKYLIAVRNIYLVFLMYILMYISLTFNSNFQNLTLQRQLYIVKNVVKSLVLLYISICSSIDFIRFIQNEYYEINLVYYYASLYVSNDLVALLIVPNLPNTTKIHHQITCLFLLYTLHINFNSIENVGKLLFIYTIFSSYAFLVNFYLGMRFLKNANNTKTYLNAIIDYSKKYAYYIYFVSCVINWSIQLTIMSCRMYNGIINLHYVLYSGLLYFIIKDDLILMSWLKN